MTLYTRQPTSYCSIAKDGCSRICVINTSSHGSFGGGRSEPPGKYKVSRLRKYGKKRLDARRLDQEQQSKLRLAARSSNFQGVRSYRPEVWALSFFRALRTMGPILQVVYSWCSRGLVRVPD